MKTIYTALIGIVALLTVVPLAAAGPPSWDTQINGQGRFKVLSQFNNEAVLDKETGLVWEQSPDTETRSWFDALIHCYQRTVGGRKGWRLPTIEELASLMDPNNPGGNPDLPPGHPFSNVQPSNYWSATTLASGTSSAWVVYFFSGIVAAGDKNNPSYV